MLLLIHMWASITIVLSNLTDFVQSASLILMISFLVVACIISSPSSNTVHWLSTASVSALLKLVVVWASMTVVGGSYRHLVQSAFLVLVGILVMETRVVCFPRSHTIHWLSTSRNSTLDVLVSIQARISVVG